MSANASPVIRQRFFNNNGVPLNGGQLFSYAAGTTTPLATYTDETGATPNANPTILDSSGYADVWLSPGKAYKFILEDSLNNQLWTKDNITQGSFADINGNLTENAFIPCYTTTATAAGTTILNVASTQIQIFTGTTTQTVTMPVATALANGMYWVITNNSTGVVTVQSSGANTIQAMAASSQLTITCINTAGGTGTASWNWVYNPNPSGGVLPISLGGTDNGSLAVTAGGILYTDGTKFQNTGAGTSGQALLSNGSSAPSWGGSSPTNNYWQGYFDQTATWSTTSTSYADPTNSGTPNLVKRVGTITVTKAGSSLPGITFTPAASTSVYLITASFTTQTPSLGNHLVGAQLVDGSSTVIAQSPDYYNLSGDGLGVTMTGIYAVPSGSAVTVKIQIYVSAGTGDITYGSAAPVIEWSLVQIK